jgi:hypothetical protein
LGIRIAVCGAVCVTIGLMPSFLAIVAGIAVLFAGGELFVAGSTALALALGIPQLVIGLTVVSLGTSAPELFVSLLASIQGSSATPSPPAMWWAATSSTCWWCSASVPWWCPCG